MRAQRPEPAFIVPATAIVPNTAGETGVMTFVGASGAAEGTVQWVPVSIAPPQSGNVHVTHGISPGTELVVTGGGALSDGQAVRRFTGFSN